MIKLNLVGEKFTNLTVLYYTESKLSPSGKRKYRYAMCECDCGRLKEVKTENLVNGNTKSCGCLQSMVSRFHTCSDDKDLTDQKFGMLYVVRRDFEKLGIGTHCYYLCKCDCGQEKILTSNEIQKRNSCGCLKQKWMRGGFKDKFCKKKDWSHIKEKMCIKCNLVKKTSEFYRMKHRYRPRCKECEKTKKRTGFIAKKKCISCENQFKIASANQKYCCKKCKENKCLILKM